MNVYEWLSKNIPDGEQVEMPASTIAKALGITTTSVRASLKKLEKDKSITITRRKNPDTGASLSNYIQVNEYAFVVSEVDILKAMAIYIDLAKKRVHREISHKKLERYKYVFQKIVTLCHEEEYNLHVYFRAMFESFSPNWCKKIFGLPYPPPTIMVNRTKVKFRYNKYISALNSKYVPFDKEIRVSVRDSIHLMQDLGVTSQEDVASLVQMELIPSAMYTAMFNANEFGPVRFVNKYREEIQRVINE